MAWRGLYKGWFGLARAFLQKKHGPEFYPPDRPWQSRCHACFAVKSGRPGVGQICKKRVKNKKAPAKNRGAYFVRHSQSGREWRE